jgi:dihydrodiol dehydrogenase / D-xylose 1-dehydrogenase (NADP)
MALTKSDALYLSTLATSKNLFLSEGMWTRYFPAIEHVRALISDAAIGDVTTVSSDFHFHTPDQEKYPESPLYDKKLAGGAGEEKH